MKKFIIFFLMVLTAIDAYSGIENRKINHTVKKYQGTDNLPIYHADYELYAKKVRKAIDRKKLLLLDYAYETNAEYFGYTVDTLMTDLVFVDKNLAHNPDMQTKIGMYYYMGIDPLAQSNKKAKMWLKSAVDYLEKPNLRKDAGLKADEYDDDILQACMMLGYIDMQEKNWEESEHYYNFAIDRFGSSDAVRMLEIMKRERTKSGIIGLLKAGGNALAFVAIATVGCYALFSDFDVVPGEAGRLIASRNKEMSDERRREIQCDIDSCEARLQRCMSDSIRPKLLKDNSYSVNAPSGLVYYIEPESDKYYIREPSNLSNDLGSILGTLGMLNVIEEISKERYATVEEAKRNIARLDQRYLNEQLKKLRKKID